MTPRKRLQLRVYPDAVPYSWESQVAQYPRLGAPGVEYRTGDTGFAKPVNCLLWRDEDGLVHGILNHYPIDMPPWEKAGNVNVFVDPARRREGIATRLVREAQRMFGPIDFEQQRFTESGAALAVTLIEQEHA